MRILILLLCFFCFSCVVHEKSIEDLTDSAHILDYKLTIESQNNSCLLNYQSSSATGQIALSPRPPCYFVRRESNEPQSFAYKDVGVRAVLIVVGTPINNKQRKVWNLSNDLVCGAEIQGILIRDNEIRSSKNVLRGGVTCKDKGSDEKNFWFFAHENK